MKTQRAYKYELKPNVKERMLLAKHAGTARFAYNWGLQQRKELYEREKQHLNAIEQHRILNGLKETQFPWMYEVSKCAPQEALRDLDKAYQHFFRGLKKGTPSGFPKFKKKGVRDSFRLTGSIKVNKKTVQLPRLGTLRLKEDSKVEGRILSATVSREADRWYVSALVEVEQQEPSLIQGEKVGIDLGLISFATLSTGERIEAPKPLKKKLKSLKKASKNHSRKIKGSNNRKKSSLVLARKYRKIRNIRQDFLHKSSTTLAKTKSEIAIEDLDIKGMLQERRLSRSISDVSWGEFRRMLSYKTRWYGSHLVIIPRSFPSSKRCSQCGEIQKSMALSVRSWVCPICKAEHDRDVNAAVNILKYSTESSSGIKACGDTSSGVRDTLTSYVPMKQEVMNGINVHKL